MAIVINADIDVFDADNNTKIKPLVQGTETQLTLCVHNNGSAYQFTGCEAYVVSYSKLDGVATKVKLESGVTLGDGTHIDDMGTENTSDDVVYKVVNINNAEVTKNANRCSIVLKLSNNGSYVYTTPLYYYVNYNPAYELEDNTSTN